MKLNKVLIRGSLVLLFAFGFSSFLHFLFQLVMSRMLLLTDYGILAVLSSIIYILLIFSESIQTIITKFATGEKNNGKLKNILKKSSKKAFIVSIALLILYFIVAVPLSFLLKIQYLLISLNGLVIFLAFFLPISRGMMQAKSRFKSLGLNVVAEAIGKLFFGILFVYVGLRVYGAIAGILLGGLIAFSLSFVSLKDVIISKEKKSKTVGIYDYAKPAFVVTFIVIFLYSIDVVMARIFFPPEIVGVYAIASILSKAVFWGTLPISKAMFPLSAENHKGKGDSQNVLYSALLIIFLCISSALAVFFFAPGLVVKLFSGKFIPEAISILFYLGIGTSLISLANLILLYKLSLGKIKNYPYLFIFVLIELLLLSFFSKNLIQFSWAFITSSAAFLFGSIVLMNE